MRRVVLEVYIDEACLACRRAMELSAEVGAAHPEVSVSLYRGGEGGGAHRHLVAAVPTYVLDGRVVSLGNPRRADLEAAIARAASGAADA